MKIYSLKLSRDRVLKYKWRHIGKETEAQNWFVQCSLWVPFINCSVDSCFSWCAPHRRRFRMCLDKDGILAETYSIHTNVSLNQARGRGLWREWRDSSVWWENWMELKTRCIQRENNESMWKTDFGFLGGIHWQHAIKTRSTMLTVCLWSHHCLLVQTPF